MCEKQKLEKANLVVRLFVTNMFTCAFQKKKDAQPAQDELVISENVEWGTVFVKHLLLTLQVIPDLNCVCVSLTILL